MSVFRQILITLLLLAGIGGGGYYYFQTYMADGKTSAGRKGRAVNVRLVKAEVGQVETHVEAVGTALARKAIDVTALASGRVRTISFRPGQAVKKGDVLVQLDDGAERAAYDEADAAVRETEDAFERAEKLKHNNTVTQATLDKLKTQLDATKARLALARKKLADRTIRASFDGVVGLRQVHEGARIDAETVLTTLDDLEEIEINFSLPEIHFGNIHIGMPVSARTAAFKDRRFDGRVATIDTRIQQASRSFKVRAILQNPDRMIPAGMFMHVSVLVSSGEAVLIPEEAVIAEGEKTFVFTVNNAKARRQDVTLGQRDKGQVAVVAGLKAGDTVVRMGHHSLSEGSAINVGNKKAGKNGAKAKGGSG